MDNAQNPLVIPVFIPHMGCPHQCAFCNQSIITNESAGTPDKKQVQETIAAYLRYKGSRKTVELAFYGGNFLGLDPNDIQSLLTVALPFVRDRMIDSIRFSTRPDTITPETLKLIESFPVGTIELGIQSMNDRVLEAADRGHSAQDTIQAVHLLKKQKYKIGAQVMVGLPWDTPESLMDSTRQVAALEPDYARIYPLLILKGSPVQGWYQKGAYHPLSLNQSVALSAAMVRLFEQENVKVIRIGLQASDMMEDDSQVVAGPWHPAFGHLVFSEIMFEDACRLIDRHIIRPSGRIVDICLEVNPKSESRLRGDKNGNIKRLMARYPGVSIHISKNPALEGGNIRVVY